MIDLIPNELDFLAIVGLIILGSFFVGHIFRRLGVPQVVGFIVAGTALGPSILGVVPQELSDSLTFVTEVALGLIGFEMGEHLRFGELRKLGKSILLIVIMQAIGAFALVFVGVYLITGSLPAAMVLGAIGMATSPAATMDVLNEYEAKGPMTTTLLAVIGIDDALTLLVYSIVAALAVPILEGGEALTLGNVLTGGGDFSLLEMLEFPLVEIGGSLLVGIVFGLFLTFVMNHLRARHEDRHMHDAMVVSIAVIFVATGLSHSLHLSVILTAMTMGVVVVNRSPKNGHYIQFTIQQAGPVLYILFFALVGADLRLDLLPQIGLVSVAYFALRILGKYFGAWVGGYMARSSKAIRDNLGLALFSQGGVAIGLALASSTRFAGISAEGDELADLISTLVPAITFIVLLVGPMMVKVAVMRSGECGRCEREHAEAQAAAVD